MNVVMVGYGSMGKVIEKKLLEQGHSLSGIISIGMEEDIHAIQKPYDVVIDFSHPNNLSMLLANSIEKHCPLVIATTGYSEVQIQTIQDASGKIPLVYTANFSLGVTVLEEVLRMITPILEDDFDIEVIEKHHNKKMDAPSGTAKMLVNVMNETKKYKEVHGREGNTKREKEIGIHAVRGGSIVGEHSVIFAGEDEVLEIKHEAHSKHIFANGAIHAAKFLIDKPNGLYTMHDVLFMKGNRI